MGNLVVDSSAWIEYFMGTDRGRKVRKHLAHQDIRVFTTGPIVTEVISKFLREGQPIGEVVEALHTLAVVIHFDLDLAKSTAEIYVRQRRIKSKFGLIDAHIVAAARLVQGKVLTCDQDFVEFKEALVLK